MRFVNQAIAGVMGVTLALATLLSLKVLGPRWENNPEPGPFLAALSVTGAFWLLAALLRRRTGLLPSSGRYAMLAAVCLAWGFAYVSVKAHDDPPVFALLGPVIWVPALFIYRLPSGKGYALDRGHVLP